MTEPFEQRHMIGSHADGKVWITVKWDGTRLSITGVVGPKNNGDCTGSAGQCVDTLTEQITPAKGWTSEMIAALHNTWERWHLNDMRSACEHQRALGWTWTSHPSAVCPECGYRLGSAWLTEEVPYEVVAWLRQLPVATIAYPWDPNRERRFG